MDQDRLEIINRSVQDWSRHKKANISLKSFQHEIGLFKKLTGKENISDVLEIGSGSGLFLIYLVLSGFAEKALGIDPVFQEDGTTRGEIYKTKSLIQELRLENKIDFKSQTFKEFLQLNPQEHYDLIFFRQTLHHVYERKRNNSAEKNKCIRDLSSARAFLKENGQICILEASRPSAFYVLIYNLYRSLRGGGKINWYNKRTGEEWIDILKQAGFKNIKLLTVPLNILSSHKILRGLGKLFSCSFLITGSRA